MNIQEHQTKETPFILDTKYEQIKLIFSYENLSN